MQSREKKLEAETSIAITAGLFATFAFNIVPSVQTVSNSGRACTACWAVSTEAMHVAVRTLEYIHLVGLALVSGFMTMSVLVATVTMFEGSRILSERDCGDAKRFESFDRWWDTNYRIRYWSRRGFLAALPFFLLSMAAKAQLWCDDCGVALAWSLVVLVGFMATLLLIHRMGVIGARLKSNHFRDPTDSDSYSSE
mmetsp:Transcript_55996/g.156063  ORF Transcript_55996/g.156063 Transcript_55996/m.156063 type:complete len:196 (-) Transcript_55996:63-650(-)